MSTATTPLVTGTSPGERLEVLSEQIAELTGQRNAIDARLVDIVAEMDRDELCGSTGARSLPALVAWKTGVTPRNAETLVAVAQRLQEFPRCAEGMREGRLSLDQVGVIAERAAEGSDEHYAQLAAVATVTQLRTAIKLEPHPDPDPRPEPQRSISKTIGEGFTTWRIRLPQSDAAQFDAALARRPHGQHTTVIVHLDVEKKTAAWHLGSLLTDEERRLLLCDTTCEIWLQHHGQPIGASRSTRQISRRLRRALEHRDHCCPIPGCGATRGLHAHHLIHWEDGGNTELDNLILLCPFHHRMHHQGGITITGPADHVAVTDADGHQLSNRSLARPPTTPAPDVPPCPGPTGERAQWWWYQPFQPPPPSTN